MFNEIARITHASVDACVQLEAFLLKRLKKDSVHVKHKALRVIKHCCQHGHATFRREMQRHTTDIKECLGARQRTAWSARGRARRCGSGAEGGARRRLRRARRWPLFTCPPLSPFRDC
jgi:hypothetical protein